MTITDITPDTARGMANLDVEKVAEILTEDWRMVWEGGSLVIYGATGTLWRIEHDGRVVEIAANPSRSRGWWLVRTPDGDGILDDGPVKGRVGDSEQELALLAGWAISEADAMVEAMAEMHDTAAREVRAEEATW